MRLRHVLVVPALLCVFYLSGCSRRPAEPPGASVTLTAEELTRGGKGSYKELQESSAWLSKSRALQDEGRYEEALYCLHRGQEKWPATDPRPANMQITKWSEDFEPLSKATLYLRMRKPELALVYLDKMPSEKLTNFYRATAHYMLKDYETADKELAPEPSLLRGAILQAKGSEAAGLEMVKTCWAKDKLSTKNSIAQGSITRAHALNVFWMENPDEVQALVKRVDPTAPSY